MSFYINNTLDIDGENPISNLQVFPISITRKSNPGARVLSEMNLTSIFRCFTDEKSFVVSDSFEAGKPFEFVINGYYCRIEKNVIPNCFNGFSNGSIYAVILLKQTSEGYPVLAADEITDGSGESATSTFTGVQFTTNPEDIKNDNGYIPYNLEILIKSGTSFTIPSTSKIKMNLTSIKLNEIDGGEE